MISHCSAHARAQSLPRKRPALGVRGWLAGSRAGADPVFRLTAAAGKWDHPGLFSGTKFLPDRSQSSRHRLHNSLRFHFLAPPAGRRTCPPARYSSSFLEARTLIMQSRSLFERIAPNSFSSTDPKFWWETQHIRQIFCGFGRNPGGYL